MPVGRKPKPTRLRELEGNRGKRPLNRNEPQPVGVPTVPKHLDKEAKREWKRISAELISLGLLTSVDRAALAAYCSAWSRWMAAEANIAKFGLVIKSPKSGFPIPNPYLGVANVALDKMRAFCTEFGMTPASRTRIQAETPSTTDPFESFMASIGGADIEAREISNDNEETIVQ